MRIIDTTVLFCALCAPVCCQVQQQRPDLCSSSSPVLLSDGVSAVVDAYHGVANLTVDRGGPSVQLSNAQEIIQICPLADARLIVFADPGFGMSVNIVDTTKPALLDSFLTGYDPVLSPNRRWLVYPKFSPRYTELPASAEYLLYDLSLPPTQNRTTGAFSLNVLDTNVGKAIYPFGWKNEPGDNVGAPEDQRHGKASAFFWAPDSGAVAFADINPQGGRDLVFVPVDAQGVGQASTSPFPAIVECDESKSRTGKATKPDTVMSVDFAPPVGTDRLLSVAFGAAGCTSRAVQMRSESFRVASRELRAVQKPALRYK